MLSDWMNGSDVEPWLSMRFRPEGVMPMQWRGLYHALIARSVATSRSECSPLGAGILMSEGVCCQEETFRGSPGALRIRSQTP
jgi:hypothetical protein